MKINGGGQPPVPDATGTEGPLENEGVGGGDQASVAKAGPSSACPSRAACPSTTTAWAGKTFAETIGGPAGPRAPEGAGPRPGEVAVRDLAADLEAGRIDPREAVDHLIERIVSLQLGDEASPQVRNQVAAALREAIEADPLLAEKLKSLG
jgi:hypothetical protein